MKVFLKYLLPLVALTLIVACQGKGTGGEAAHKGDNAALSQTNNGSYQGVVPAADGPGIYMLLAINGDQYQLLEKYLETPDFFVTQGTLTWDQAHETITLGDDGRTFKIQGNTLGFGNTSLNKISEETQIDSLFLSSSLLNEATGDYATLWRTTKHGMKEVRIQYLDQDFTLPIDAANIQQEAYKQGDTTLVITPVDATTGQQSNPILTIGGKTYKFTITSPSNVIYVAAKEKNTPLHGMDVMYYTGDDTNYVKLMNHDAKYCFTLPQTEAYAKGATYGNDAVTWESDGNTATLTIDGVKYQYTNADPLADME